VKLPENLCFSIAKRMVDRRKRGEVGENPSTFDPFTYAEWRDDCLKDQFTRHFSTSDLKHQDVLDFGCGQGGLSILAAQAGAKSITGIDANEAQIAFAKDRLRNLNHLPVSPKVFKAKDFKTIDLPAASIDAVLCFDTLEHIMEYESIIREWHRVLRPGGRVFIWWVPWWNPYGPHIESLVPIPWAHVFFSDRVLVNTCARMYDRAEFKPRLWDLDETGRKKPNKWLTMKSLPEVNRLTIARFEKTYRQIGFKQERREIFGFGGSLAGRTTRVLTRIPLLRDFFCSCTVYLLRKPTGN
jgi:ubiquinone/menaquinone biosynthesis C-methylase UbiE